MQRVMNWAATTAMKMTHACYRPLLFLAAFLWQQSLPAFGSFLTAWCLISKLMLDLFWSVGTKASVWGCMVMGRAQGEVGWGWGWRERGRGRGGLVRYRENTDL